MERRPRRRGRAAGIALTVGLALWAAQARGNGSHGSAPPPAAASGVVSKRAKARSSGWPSSRSATSRTSAKSIGGASACSAARALRISAGMSSEMKESI